MDYHKVKYVKNPVPIRTDPEIPVGTVFKVEEVDTRQLHPSFWITINGGSAYCLFDTCAYLDGEPWTPCDAEGNELEVKSGNV